MCVCVTGGHLIFTASPSSGFYSSTVSPSTLVSTSPWHFHCFLFVYFFPFFCIWICIYCLDYCWTSLWYQNEGKATKKQNKTPSVLKYCIAIVFMPSTTCKCLCIKCGLKWNWTILLLFAVILTSAVDHCCESSKFCLLICNKYLWNLTSFVVFIVFIYATARPILQSLLVQP